MNSRRSFRFWRGREQLRNPDMNPYLRNSLRPGRLLLVLPLVTVLSFSSVAQWPPFATPTTPAAQRGALNAVRSQINWLQNATRTSSNYGGQGYGNIQQSFQAVRDAYGALKRTLTPQQAAYGANDLAELDAGLDIIQEAFGNYDEDVAAGQPVSTALNNLGRILRQSCAVWLQEFNRTCSSLRVGWG